MPFHPVTAVFPSAGMLHSLVGFCFDVICCRFKLGAYRPREVRANRLVFTTTDTQAFVLLCCDGDLTDFAESSVGHAATDEQCEPSPDSTVGWTGTSGVASCRWLLADGHFSLIFVLFNALLFLVSPFVMKLCFRYYQKEVLLWNYCEACLLKIFPHTRWYLS